MIFDFEIEEHIVFIRNFMLLLVLVVILVNAALTKLMLNKYVKKDKEGVTLSRIGLPLIIGNTLLILISGALTLLVILSNDLVDGLTMVVYLVGFVVYLLYVVKLYYEYFNYKFTVNTKKNYIEVLNSKDNHKIYMESVKRIDKVSGYYIIYYNDEDMVTLKRNLVGLDSIMTNNIRNKYNINFNF